MKVAAPVGISLPAGTGGSQPTILVDAAGGISSVRFPLFREEVHESLDSDVRAGRRKRRCALIVRPVFQGLILEQDPSQLRFDGFSVVQNRSYIRVRRNGKLTYGFDQSPADFATQDHVTFVP